MASASESSTPSSQSLPFPSGESKLELTPTEILIMIFDELPQIDLRSCFHHFEIRDNELLEANRSAYGNMRSLCLTSKRVDSVARPFLFQNVTISSPERLLQLYNAVLGDSELGCHVRQIGFETPFDDISIPCTGFKWSACSLPSIRGGGLLTDSHVKLLTEGNFDLYDEDRIYSYAIFDILSRTPNTHRLVLRLQTDLDDDVIEFNTSHRPFFEKVQNAIDQSITGRVTKFLPRLKALQLLGDLKTWTNGFDINTCVPLLRLPTLEMITCVQANDCVSDFNPYIFERVSSPARIYKNVKVAELHDCPFDEEGWLAFQTALPNLESLDISIRVHPWFHQEDLANALSKLQSLHTLRLEYRFDLMRGEDLDPYQFFLPSTSTLASLPRLATLKIPLQMLVDDDSKMSDRLVETLPKSLRHLTLILQAQCPVHWWDDMKVGRDRISCFSSSTVIGFLEALIWLGNDMFPDLQEVVCCYSMRGCKTYPELEPVDDAGADLGEIDLFGLDDDSSRRLEQLRTLIRLQSIRFSVRCESIYCQGPRRPANKRRRRRSSSLD